VTLDSTEGDILAEGLLLGECELRVGKEGTFTARTTWKLYLFVINIMIFLCLKKKILFLKYIKIVWMSILLMLQKWL